MFKLRGIALIIIVISLFIGIAPRIISAQEEPQNIFQLFQKVEGSFEVAFAIQPRLPTVGHLHFVVTITDAKTGKAIDGSIVKLTAEHPEEESIEVRVLNTPNRTEEYHANMTLPESGIWSFTLDIEKDGLIPASLQTDIYVDEPTLPAGQAGTFVWILVFSALVGGSLFLWNKSRKVDQTNSIVSRR